jgi:hypothetical protein
MILLVYVQAGPAAEKIRTKGMASAVPNKLG